MLAGNITAITVGAILAIIVSLITRRSMTKQEVEEEWEKTREIDNPLSPWVQKYKVHFLIKFNHMNSNENPRFISKFLHNHNMPFQGELNLEEGDTFHDRPPLDIVIICNRIECISFCFKRIFRI